MRPNAAPPTPGEAGLSLIEITVAVGLLALIAAGAAVSLAQRPAQTATTVTRFAALVAQARALAAITGDPLDDAASGASIGVERDGDVYVATVYAYRPARGGAHGPQRRLDTPPLRTATPLLLGSANAALAPPFAVFFAPSGHAAAQANVSLAAGVALAAEPTCPRATGIVVTFGSTGRTQSRAISCELAQLEPTPLASAAP